MKCLFPIEFCREHGLLPKAQSIVSDSNIIISNDDAELFVASLRCLSRTPPSQAAIDNLSLYFGMPIELVPTAENELQALIDQTYQKQMSADQAMQMARQDQQQQKDRPASVEQELASLSDRDLLASGSKQPVAKLLDSLLFDALSKHASDMHLHPYPDKLIVRYRIDGVLHNIYQPPLALHDQLVGRVKVLAGMDVAEKRLAQDGRTSVRIGDRQIDLRVSTLPTTEGERVVIRLLEQTAKLESFTELGMPKDVQHAFGQAIQRSHGLILVTGPTGSGKTTTLYSALSQLDSTQKNILTLEDPVEYRLHGISQTQVSSKKGMTFLNGLRHVLRQDPDVILVGEVRDEPTARMVIQSAMTGHLVLTTLHTNTAATAVARLVDLGIEPYLIASSLIGVLAQRLVRRSCPECKGQNGGCESCHHTGYVGRQGVYEWLAATPEIRNQIQSSADADKLEAIATQQGTRTLWQEGQKLVESGVTTLSELQRVLGQQEQENPAD